MEYGFVPGQLAHFSINADDLPVTQAFYSAVFGWKYHAYGPPGFYMVQTTPDGVTPAPMVGSVQVRSLCCMAAELFHKVGDFVAGS